MSLGRQNILCLKIDLVLFKELSFCNKLLFINTYNFATQYFDIEYIDYFI